MFDEPKEEEASEWVKVKSEDGYTFIVPRKAARGSGVLRMMLSSEGGFVEARSNTCELKLRAVVTEKVLEYLVFKAQYENAGPKEEVPDFLERIVPEFSLEMLMAADYLEA